jgi:hypothetical protein
VNFLTVEPFVHLIVTRDLVLVTVVGLASASPTETVASASKDSEEEKSFEIGIFTASVVYDMNRPPGRLDPEEYRALQVLPENETLQPPGKYELSFEYQE